MLQKRENANLTLAERLRVALHERQVNGQCLLLDVSASMGEDVEPGRRKIDALREIAAGFRNVRRFVFSGECVELDGSADVPSPQSHTDMASAFEKLHAAKVRHAVIVTDGQPDDANAALQAARGLKLDIFYVGPPPRPAFLDQLARATGGSCGTSTLKRAEAPQLAARIRGLLSA